MKLSEQENSPIIVHRSHQVKLRTVELTDAAYSVLLRSGTSGWWIDLELDIWRTLEDAADRPIESKTSVSPGSNDVNSGSQSLVDALTDAVYRTALRHGLRRPFLDVELVLYRTVQRVMGIYSQPCG